MITKVIKEDGKIYLEETDKINNLSRYELLTEENTVGNHSLNITVNTIKNSKSFKSHLEGNFLITGNCIGCTGSIHNRIKHFNSSYYIRVAYINIYPVDLVRDEGFQVNFERGQVLKDNGKHENYIAINLYYYKLKYNELVNLVEKRNVESLYVSINLISVNKSSVVKGFYLPWGGSLIVYEYKILKSTKKLLNKEILLGDYFKISSELYKHEFQIYVQQEILTNKQYSETPMISVKERVSKSTLDDIISYLTKINLNIIESNSKQLSIYWLLIIIIVILIFKF